MTPTQSAQSRRTPCTRPTSQMSPKAMPRNSEVHPLPTRYPSSPARRAAASETSTAAGTKAPRTRPRIQAAPKAAPSATSNNELRLMAGCSCWMSSATPMRTTNTPSHGKGRPPRAQLQAAHSGPSPAAPPTDRARQDRQPGSVSTVPRSTGSRSTSEAYRSKRRRHRPQCHEGASPRPRARVHPQVHGAQAGGRQTCASAHLSCSSTREDPVRYQGSGGSRLPLILFIVVAIAVVAVAYFLFLAPK